MRIFLVAGKSGSGKNEVAKHIREYYAYKQLDSCVTSYSKYIDSFARELTDWDGAPGNKPRDFMQALGTEIRQLDPYFFTKAMIRDIAVYQKHVDVLIVSNVRMPEEIDEIRNNYDDVCAIYVENQFQPSPLTVEQQAHPTETSLEGYFGFDYTIANNGDATELHDKVFKLLEGLE